jgi:hypothetical protein
LVEQTCAANVDAAAAELDAGPARSVAPSDEWRKEDDGDADIKLGPRLRAVEPRPEQTRSDAERSDAGNDEARPRRARRIVDDRAHPLQDRVGPPARNTTEWTRATARLRVM